MKKNSRKEEISFYYLYLKNYLDSYRFAGISDDFVRLRAEAAADAYSSARRRGYDVDRAHELSMSTLLDGFRYSDYEIIMDVLETEFQDDISNELRPFMATHLQSVKAVENVFNAYDVQSDSFVNSGEYNKLYCELTGTISTLLTGYGL